MMYILLCTGALFWVIYGILLKASPIIITNSIIFSFSLIILLFKIKEGLTKKQ